MSDDGRRSPSDDPAVVDRDGDEVLGTESAYGTPLGLMAIIPARGRSPLALPNDSVTGPLDEPVRPPERPRARRRPFALIAAPSEATGQVVVGLVPADLLAEAAERGRLVDQQELDAGHLGEVGERLGPERR